jgi:hypothetical protein
MAFEVGRLRRELGRARQRADWYARACEGQKGEIEAISLPKFGYIGATGVLDRHPDTAGIGTDLDMPTLEPINVVHQDDAREDWVIQTAPRHDRNLKILFARHILARHMQGRHIRYPEQQTSREALRGEFPTLSVS